MKKLLLPICAMLLCMTACKKEENNGILRLEIEHFSSDTKLHLDAAHFAVWDNNDEVLLNSDRSDRKPVTISNGTATISDVATADNYTAVYPSSWTTSTSSITYPEFQFNYNDRVIAPMAAKYEDGKLMFKNLGAILAVNVDIPMTVERIEVIADGTTSISGTFPISYDGTRPTIGTPNSTDGTNMTTLICNTEVTSSKTFYIAMPAVSAKLTIKVYGDEYCYTKTQNNSLTLQANHGYSITLSNDSFTATPMPASNQIFYTASEKIDDDDIELAQYNYFTISEHTFNESTGQGIITFNEDIDYVGGDIGTRIHNSIFSNCTSIILPASVQYIESYTFYNCASLTSVIMPGVTSVGLNAFEGCTSLRTVSMPMVNSFSANAFSGCSSLTTVSMPSIKNVSSSLGTNVFYGCVSLKNVYCNSSVVPHGSSRPFPSSISANAKLHLPLSEYNTLTWNNWAGQYYYDL